LTEPRNALVKQYQQLFALDGVEVEFTQEALQQVAKEAIQRNTGARGLRAIMENVLMNIMFEVPSRRDVRKVIIDGAVMRKEKPPVLLLVNEVEEQQPLVVNQTE